MGVFLEGVNFLPLSGLCKTLGGERGEPPAGSRGGVVGAYE